MFRNVSSEIEYPYTAVRCKKTILERDSRESKSTEINHKNEDINSCVYVRIQLDVCFL